MMSLPMSFTVHHVMKGTGDYGGDICADSVFAFDGFYSSYSL